MVESGSVLGILEYYTTDDLKKKLNHIDALLKSVDSRSKHIAHIFPFSNRAPFCGKYFCVDCGKRLTTRHAKRCQSCNMKNVGKNHMETRKAKESA